MADDVTSARAGGDETGELRAHLVASGLAGEVQTSPGQVRSNCRKLVEGHPDYTFGLSGWADVSLDEVRAAVVALCGERAVAADPDGAGWIDPDRCVAAIGVHRRRLAAFVASGGRVLLATGHPTGLLIHYATVARALDAAGCELLAPLDDEDVVVEEGDGELTVRPRFFDGAAAMSRGGDLLHTHRPDLMEHLLDALEGARTPPDLVLGDHGLAGAAVERGYPTLSIADVNDPALPLAQVRQRTDAVLVIDDNLAPRLFAPVTAFMLADVR